MKKYFFAHENRSEEGAKLSISLKSVGISLDYTQPKGCDGKSRKASVRTGIYTDVR